MSGDPGLEQRYRRVLRLLPGYYRDRWEDDMVAAYLDSWMTGDPEVDGCVLEFCRPDWPEVVSVTALAVRLRLGGAGAPARYFAWGQAVRNAVLATLLAHVVRGIAALVLLAWSHLRVGGLPAMPAALVAGSPGTIWPVVFWLVDGSWIVIFAALLLGRYRPARLLAAVTIVPYLILLVQSQFTGGPTPDPGDWAFWALLDLAAVLAMTAFHRDAPPVRWRPWLLGLAVGCLGVAAPLLAAQATGNAQWLPDLPGLCCVVVALACLAHLPGAWFRRDAASGVRSLTLTLLAAATAAFRVVSLGDYVHDPHLITVSVAELLILAVAAALVIPDAARAQTAAPAASPPRPLPG
jgi:hypothetical protein